MGCGGTKNDIKDSAIVGKTKLYYFDAYGKAEVIRMILHYKGATFEDHKVPSDKWQELKNSGLAEFGSLPVLEIDDRKLVEQRAIVRYLCKKFGYYPKDLLDSYWAESVCDFKEDIVAELFGSLLNQKDLPFLLSKLEARLNRNNSGTGWFVGNSVSIADFQIFELVWDFFLRKELKSIFEIYLNENAKNVRAWADRFLNSSPKLKAYLDSRPSKPL